MYRYESICLNITDSKKIIVAIAYIKDLKLKFDFYSF